MKASVNRLFEICEPDTMDPSSGSEAEIGQEGAGT